VCGGLQQPWVPGGNFDLKKKKKIKNKKKIKKKQIF
jgi:hypothetical protein